MQYETGLPELRGRIGESVQRPRVAILGQGMFATRRDDARNTKPADSGAHLTLCDGHFGTRLRWGLDPCGVRRVGRRFRRLSPTATHVGPLRGPLEFGHSSHHTPCDVWSLGVRAAVAHPSRGCRNAVFQTAAIALRACEHAGCVIASSREHALPQHGSIAFHPPRQRLAEEDEAGEMDLVTACRRIQPDITRSVMTTMPKLQPSHSV